MTDDISEQERQRRDKLAALRESANPYPNDFRRDALAGEVHAWFGDTDAPTLEADKPRVIIAGRMMTRRAMTRRQGPSEG